MSKKESNFEMVFYCKELGLQLHCKKYSANLLKIIRQKNDPPGRIILTGYHTDLFEELVHLWEDGDLLLPGKNNFESLAHFIYRVFEVRYTLQPDKKMQLKSIITEIYKYKMKK